MNGSNTKTILMLKLIFPQSYEKSLDVDARLRITKGMLLLTKAKRPLKFKMLCGFNKHAVKLRMHKAAPYAFRKKPLIHSEAIKATIKEI